VNAQPANVEADAALFTFTDVTVVGSDGRHRLHGVDTALPTGGVTALVGPSGSGKSTLLRCCNRLEATTGGAIRFRGVPLESFDPLDLRRRVAMVFQRPTPFAGTVRDNLLVAAADLTDAGAGALLTRVHLDESFLDRDATELSGGEAQRMCLARSLAVEPDVMLMDEVTSSVDHVAKGVLESLARALSAAGMSIIWVTHDLDQAARLADHTVVLIDGRVADDATAAAYLNGASDE
jgi:putative ABC transport system ATP-binding protein